MSGQNERTTGSAILQALRGSEEPLTLTELSHMLPEAPEDIVLTMSDLAERGLVTPRRIACLVYWSLAADDLDDPVWVSEI